MIVSTEKREILAPAGSAEQLTAAVNNGCDSVYLGLDCFNARMKAPNFTRENFGYWLDFCHLFGVKVYVTINTSLKNDEFDKAADLLKFVYKSGADGVIVTDIALMKIAARLRDDDFEVAASTQLNIHNGCGAEFARKCGATTVVCARECSLDQIKRIVETGVKTECFIHGATCVCQSGQCLFSSMVGGNSGNRGLCAQPCRKLYSADKGKSFGYLLSARDLCGLDIAEELSEAGVVTYKIEGRNRRAEYAGITSRIYRKLFDGIRCDDVDRNALAEIYNRDMSALQYLRGGNSDIISPLCQNHFGVAIGKICKNKIKTAVPVMKGDGFKVFDRGREVCGATATESGTGLIAAKFTDKVYDGMDVRRTTSVSLCNDILSKRRTLSVKLVFSAYPNETATICAICGDVSVEMQSDFVVPQAETVQTTREELTKQLQKSGNSYYTICDIVVDSGDIFLAKSQINGLRRAVLEKLTDKLLQRYRERVKLRSGADLEEKFFVEQSKRRAKISRVAVTCYTEEQLRAAAECADILVFKPNELTRSAYDVARAFGAYLDLPSFTDDAVLDMLKTVRPRIVANNVGQVEWARQLGLNYIAGGALNIFNDHMAEQFEDADTFVYSSELTLSEISRFADQSGLVFVDGNIVLMKLVHCPYKVATGCDCSACRGDEPLTYRDEQGNEFYIYRRRAGRCTFELVNGKKLSAIARIKRGGGYLVDYDEAVVRHYKLLNDEIDDGYTENKPYTKGRLFDKIN